MKKRFYTSVLVFSIVLSICIFTGCGNDKGSNDSKGDNASKSSFASSKKFSSWPNDLPKFKGGKLFQVINDENTGVLRAGTFMQIKKPDAAYKNYKTTLIKKGWVLDMDNSNEYGYGGVYLKGSKSLHVSIKKDGAVAQIIYINR